MTKEEHLERFNSLASDGLTTEQVEYMVKHKKTNVAKSPTNKSYAQIVFGNIFTFLNILMAVVAAILLIFVGTKVITNLLFLIILVFNLIIGIVQECKSKHTIEKLKLLSNNKIKAIRNKKEVMLRQNEIVLDDVLILSPGDQVPADCIILDDGFIEINESLLTGESVPVKKHKGDSILAGSFVVAGTFACRADKVGNDTYLNSIEKKAKLSKQPKSQLMLAIRKIINVLTCISIPLSIVVLLNEIFQRASNPSDGLVFWPSFWGEESIIGESIFYSGTTITYMIPCGMALLASVAMAAGVIKLSSYKVLAQDLYSVESLSRINTLCLDKTGTLTDGTMSVDSFISINKKYDEAKIEELLGSYLSSFKSTNQTSNALLNRFKKNDVYKQEELIQFSSDRKYSAVKFEKLGWFILGAPEYLTTDVKILDKVNAYASDGLRVVLFGKAKEVKENEKNPKGFEAISLIVIRDTIRKEVKDTMLWFKENDVDIKVISGDNIATVRYIAKECGIDNYDSVVDMSKVTEEDDLEELVLNNAIFGRVSPEQKAEIIKILKKNDRVVAVTGDGLNDLLAFKQADCCIALENGAAATKNVANLILLDSNFANMKEAVYQGRRVVNNIQRSATLFVMKDFLWLFITVLPLLIGVEHVIQPTVMTITNIFLTGIASFFLSFETDKSRFKGNFLRNVLEKAVSAGFYMFLPVLFIMVGYILVHSIKDGSYNIANMGTVFENGEIISLGWIPVISICITIFAFVVFFDICQKFTKYRKILFFITVGLVLIILYLAPENFIVSGTELMKEVSPAGEKASLIYLFKYIFTHIGHNATLATFKTLTMNQVLTIVFFAVVAVPLYFLNKKIANILFEFAFGKKK